MTEPLSIEAWQTKFLALKNNRIFEAIVISIILLSAVLIGAHTYNIAPEYLQALKLLDYGVTVFFVFELSVRFWAEPDKRSFFKNPWNVFDTLIVVVSLIPLSHADVALLGRLIRIFRVLRMVSVIPELRMLLNSLLRALPQLGYVLLLMFIIFYIYAAVGSTFFSGINEVLWGDVAIALLTMFRVMTFEDWTDIMYETMEVYPLSWLFYLSFIFFTAFAFLNMVIGIVVNVMEKEQNMASDAAHDQHEKDVESDLTEILKQVKSLRTEVAELKGSRLKS